MALPPLTHHDIMELVAPFSAAGWKLDLEASDRVARRLRFKPHEHAAAAPMPAFLEALELEHPYRGTFRLTRTVTLSTGPVARLTAESHKPDPLLARVAAVAPASQFRFGEGHVLVLDQQIDPSGALGLLRGEAHLHGLKFTFTMPQVSGLAAEITLENEAGGHLELPKDLLAVLGWDWAPLVREAKGWGSLVRLRGKGEEHSRRALAKLETTVAHLARTLGEPPERFHPRFLAARWAAAVRRTLPVLTSVLVMVLAAAMPSSVVDAHPAMREVLMTAPLLLIALSFTLQEMARVEIAAPPRPLTAPSWRTAAAAAPARRRGPSAT
jgi:hypothetical protein